MQEKSFSADQVLRPFNLHFKEKLTVPEIPGSYDPSTSRWDFGTDLSPEQLAATYCTIHSTGSPDSPEDDEDEGR